MATPNDAHEFSASRVHSRLVETGYKRGSARKCRDALYQLLKIAKQLHYLEVVSQSEDGDMRAMVELRLACRRSNVSPSMIKADLHTLWRLELASGGNSVCRLEDTHFGFQLHFAVMYSHGYFVTGLVAVDLTASHKIKVA